MMRSWAIAVTIAILAFGTEAAAEDGIVVCSEADPPPWIYWQRDASGQKTNEIVGFSVDLMRHAFEAIGQKVTFMSLPWRRCKHYLETKKVDFGMDVPMADKYRNAYEYSVHYNTLTSAVFYADGRSFPVRTLEDLKPFRECNFAPVDLRDSSTPTGAPYSASGEEQALAKKIKAGHCDYFLADWEFVAGYRLIGADILADLHIGHRPIRGAGATTYHLVALRGTSAAALLPALNIAIEEAIRSGLAGEMWRRHAGDLAYHP